MNLCSKIFDNSVPWNKLVKYFYLRNVNKNNFIPYFSIKSIWYFKTYYFHGTSRAHWNVSFIYVRPHLKSPTPPLASFSALVLMDTVIVRSHCTACGCSMTSTTLGILSLLVSYWYLIGILLVSYWYLIGILPISTLMGYLTYFYIGMYGVSTILVSWLLYTGYWHTGVVKPALFLLGLSDTLVS